MNLLAIGSHPDDIEFGCSGTLIKYRLKGDIIYLLVMTSGELSGKPELRRKEQINSQKIMGAKELIWGGHRDTKLEMSLELIQQIEKAIKKIEPTFIFVNYPEDTHQDHRHLAQATISATRYIRNVLFYEVPTTVNFAPNVFVDIMPTFDLKLECLKAHESQIMKTGIEELSILNMALASAYFRGTQARVKYAEGFVSQRLFINI
jgi:LmbE family N-acetylglucosaminyl deacetylase